LEEHGSYSSAISRILSLKKSGKYQDAEDEIRHELEKNPDHLLLKVSLADLYLYRGRLAEARIIVEEVLTQDPQHPQALAVLGDIFLKQHSFQEALECYQQAFNRDPRPYLNLKTARVLKEMEEYEEALQELNKALVVKPGSLAFLKEKAFILNRMKRYDEAMETYGKVNEISPNDPFVQKEILRLRSRTRPDEQVLKELQRVVGMDSKKDDAQMHGLLAQKLKEAGQVREAVAEYGTAAKLAPGNLFFVKQQGFCLHELKRYDEAIRCLSEVFRRDPTDFFVRSALEKSFGARGDLTGLLDLYEKTSQLHRSQKFLLGKIRKIRRQLGHPQVPPLPSEGED